MVTATKTISQFKLAALFVAISSVAQAQPQLANIAAGDVAVLQNVNQTVINQRSQYAIANWQNFSIGADHSVRINQPTTSAAILNRVLGADPSRLLGDLSANGQVYLVNPNGVTVGSNARIDAASFFATTAQISDQDFLAGNLAFNGGSNADIVNLGEITAHAGDVVLVGLRVKNDGSLKAIKGNVSLAAATEFVYSNPKQGDILVSTGAVFSQTDTGVDNQGLIEAARVRLSAANGNIYDLAVNQAGVVRARAISHEGGRILLSANGGAIKVDGNLNAINQNGGGGEILIGGDSRIANNPVPSADTVLVSETALLDVSAQNNTANGGRIVVWSQQQTDFSGVIAGQGGSHQGDGAFAEVSSLNTLNYWGNANLTAAAGDTGTLLLDPNAAIISAATDDQANGVFNTAVLQSNLAGANIVIDTSRSFGDITLAADLSWSSANSLTLKSADSININADVNASNANSRFEILAGFSGMSGREGSTLGNINIDSSVTIRAASVVLGFNSDAFIGNGPGQETLGEIVVNGAIIADLLDLQIPSSGATSIVIDNNDNQIGTLTTSAGGVVTDDGFTLVNGQRDLLITGQLNEIGTDVLISTLQNLTLGADAQINSNAGNVSLSAVNFTNNAGSGALSASNLGNDTRVLVYADNPTDSELGGLMLSPVYNKNLLTNTPSSITQTGNRILYNIAPTLEITVDEITRLYGASGPGLSYSVSGLIGGDSFADALTGSALISTNASSNSDVGNYLIDITLGSLLSDFNYDIELKAGELVIDPAPLIISADNLTRRQLLQNPILTASYQGLVAGDSAADISGVVLSTSAIPGDAPGEFEIVVSGAFNSNYDITLVNGVLTVTPAPVLSISADDVSRLYGQVNPIFSSTIQGFESGDDVSIISGLSYNVLADQSSAVGTYSITPVDAVASGYLIDYQVGTLTIDPAALVITALDVARLYGDSNPLLELSYNGFVNGENATALTGVSVSTVAQQGDDVGDYVITLTVADAGNYAITTNNGVLSVNPAPLNIAVNSGTELYGDTPRFTATTAGLKLDQSIDDIGQLTFSSAAQRFSDVGSYLVSADFFGAVSPNYAVTFNNGSVQINPRGVTITAPVASKIYGEVNPVLSASLSLDQAGAADILEGFNADIVLTTAATTNTDVGNYRISASAVRDPNFTIHLVAGELEITPAPLTIRADNLARTALRENPALTATYTGLVSDDNPDDITGISLSTAARAEDAPGEFVIALSGGFNSNYDITLVNGVLTVNQAPLLTITADDFSRVYGQGNPGFTVNITGFDPGDDAGLVSGIVYTVLATPQSPVGNYDITPSAAVAAGYLINYEVGTLTIDPAALTITALDAVRLYGDANPQFAINFDGLVNGDDISVVDGLVAATIAQDNDAVGDYTISLSGASANNYVVQTINGVLSINPAPLTVSVNDSSTLFGNRPVFSADTSGLKLADSIEDVGTLSFAASSVQFSDVGSYAVTAGLFGDVSNNYEVTIVDGILDILPRGLTISAADSSRIYGAENPVFSASISLDQVGDLRILDFFDSALQLSTAATTGTNVGAYPINVTAQGDANFILNFVPASLHITPASLTIQADDLGRRQLQANPDFSATYTGLVAGDSAADINGVVLGSIATPDNDPGLYTISISGGENNNYDISLINGSLTVTPALVLTISADNFNRVYGQLNPDFTATISGFDSGDDASVVSGLLYQVLADVTSSVGTYSITPSSAVASGYLFDYQSGSLTVNPADLTITALDAARFYGDENPEFSLSYVGLVNGDEASLVTELSVFSAAQVSDDVDSYVITLSGGIASNYNVATVSGNLRVQPAPLNVSVNNASQLFGDTPQLSVSSSGLKLSDSLSDIGQIQISSTSEQYSDVGSYTLSAQFLGESSENYAINFENGVLEIDPRGITVFALSDVAVYKTALGDLGFRLALDESGTDEILQQFDSNINLSTLATENSDVGSYPITVSATADPNFNIRLVDSQFDIVPRFLTINTFRSVRAYGQQNEFGVQVSGLADDEIFEDITEAIIFSTLANSSSAVGQYAVSASVELNTNNYELQSVNGNVLDIFPAPLTLKVDSLSRLFGDLNPELTYSLEGLTNGDSVDDVLVSLAVNAIPSSTVGLVGISITQASAENYSIRLEPGTLTINPRPVTISVDSFSREYGELNPQLTATFEGFSEFVGPQSVEGLSLRTNANIFSGVQTLGIFASVGFNPNYNITLEFGQATITPAPLTTVIGEHFQIYGRARPGLAPTFVDGLKLGDSFASLGLRADISPLVRDVGSYEIGALISNPNYELVAAPGLLTILPAVLNVAINNQSRLFGERNATASGGAIGLANGDNFDDVIQLIIDADIRTNVGNRTIFPELVSKNYILGDVDLGNLAILPRSLAIKPANIVRYFGDIGPALELLVAGDGLASFDDITAVADTELFNIRFGQRDFSLDAAPNERSDAGVRQVLANLNGNPNYVVKNLPGAYSILPRPITLRVDNVTAIGGGPLPDFSATASNLADFDNLASAFPNLQYRAVPGSDAVLNSAATPDSLVLPEVLTDQFFLASYSNPEQPAADNTIETDTALVVLSSSDDFNVLGPVLILDGLLLSSSTITSTLFSPQQTQSKAGTFTQYVQPVGYDSNSNYVVTVANKGELTWVPDPILAEQLAETRRKIAEAAANKANFYQEKNPRGLAFGIPGDALPSIINALYFEVAAQKRGGVMSPLEVLLQRAGGYESTDGFSQKDVYAFLSDLHSNPAKQELVAPIISNYLISLAGGTASSSGPLVKKPESFTAADNALIAHFTGYLEQARDELVDKMVVQEQIHKAEIAKQPILLTALLGDSRYEVPYKDIFASSTQQLIESHLARNTAIATTGGAVAGGAVATALSAVLPALFPHAIIGSGLISTTSLLATSAGLVTETTSTAVVGISAGTTLAGPALIVGAAVVIGITRGIEVFDAAKKEHEFKQFVASKGQSFDFKDIDLKSEEASAGINQTLFLSAISAMMADTNHSRTSGLVVR